MTFGDDIIGFTDREVAEPDAQLVGPLWTVETIIQGESASSVPMDPTATIQFDADGGMTFNDGCNGGGGRYSIDGSTLTLSDLVTEDRACVGPAGQLAQAVLAVLNAGRITFSIDQQSLTLEAGAAGLQLTAR
jgi:heat shock protein HslJ